jgi:hypothetical protein
MRAFLEKFEAEIGGVRAWALDQGLTPDGLAALEAAMLVAGAS